MDPVVGCDGRHSLTRSTAGLEVIEHGVPINILWFRISRAPGDSAQVLGNVNYGKAVILINRSIISWLFMMPSPPPTY